MAEESPNNTRKNITKEDLPTIAKKLGISSSWCKNDDFLKMVVNMIYAFAMQTRVDPTAGVGLSCLNILVGMPMDVVDHIVKLKEYDEEYQKSRRKLINDHDDKVRSLKRAAEKQESRIRWLERDSDTYRLAVRALAHTAYMHMPEIRYEEDR